MHVDNSSAALPRISIQRWVWGVFALLFVAIVVSVVVFAPFPAQAGVKEAIAEFISWVLSAIVSVLGKLLLVAVYLLTLIAQYNDFVNAAAVVNGWVIVRDVGNMFFIIVLLIIAFATILNIPNYQWKALLPKLVIAAILINFSKTIAGLLIDFSQVITLTFVNGFAAAAGGNFAQMYKIRELVTLNPAGGGGVDLLAILGGYFLAFVMLAIALTTTLIMAVIFAFRIVMLWALVVLSPLPYVLNLLPQGKKYGDKWWSMFGEYLTVGPVLAFFLWLALVSVGSGDVKGFTGTGGAGASTAELAEYEKSTSAIATDAGKPSSLISFVISIAMLIAGLKITGEMGVIGAGAAKGALDKFGSIAKGAAKRATGYRYAEALYGVRKKRKEEEFQGRVAKVQAGLGYVQQGIGTGLKYGVGGLGVGAGHAAFGRRANREEADAKRLGQEAALARDTGDFTGAAAKEKAATDARARAASLRTKQRWTERGVNATVAGIATIATGGAGAVLIPGMLGRGLQGAGKKNVSDAQQHTYKRMNAERDAVKNLKPEDILKKVQGGPDVSNAEQMAAMITAIEKQLVSGTELPGMEAKMRSLGADEKTMSTFQSTADQKYPGTRLTADDRRRRVAAGTMPTKDLDAAELAGDNGALAKDFVLSGTAAQRKDLGQSKTLKAAYQAGLQAAAIKATDPGEQQKLRAELMRLGGDKATGRTALQVSGMDPAALATALQGPMSSDLLANIEPADLANPAVLDAIVKSVNPARMSAAVGSAKKPDADPQAFVNMAALQEAIKGSQRAKDYETARTPVRGVESDVASVRKNLEKQQAIVRRAPAGSPQAATATAAAGRLTTELAQAEASLQALQQQFDDQMKNVLKMEKQEQDLHESMKRSKNKR